MSSKTRILQTVVAVLLIISAGVIFFWEYISIVIFPREVYAKPDDEPPQVAQTTASITPAPTTAAPSLTPGPQATPTATPEPTPTPPPVRLAKWDELFAVNDDLMGWVTVPDTDIDYPVVLASPEDDATVDDGFYYLHHNFDRRRDEQGAIFLYPGSDILTTRNLLIFGHNQRNLRMFGSLKYYNYLWTDSALEQYKKSPLVEFDTIYADGMYKMFAFLLIDEREEGFFNFMYNNFTTEDVFMSYAEHLRMHSIINTTVDIQPGDELITLVSCTSQSLIEQGKFIVVARKVREGESLDVDVEGASFNPYAIVPESLQRAWSRKVPTPEPTPEPTLSLPKPGQTALPVQ